MKRVGKGVTEGGIFWVGIHVIAGTCLPHSCNYKMSTCILRRIKNLIRMYFSKMEGITITTNETLITPVAGLCERIAVFQALYPLQGPIYPRIDLLPWILPWCTNSLSYPFKRLDSFIGPCAFLQLVFSVPDSLRLPQHSDSKSSSGITECPIKFSFSLTGPPFMVENPTGLPPIHSACPHFVDGIHINVPIAVNHRTQISEFFHLFDWPAGRLSDKFPGLHGSCLFGQCHLQITCTERPAALITVSRASSNMMKRYELSMKAMVKAYCLDPACGQWLSQLNNFKLSIDVNLLFSENCLVEVTGVPSFPLRLHRDTNTM